MSALANSGIKETKEALDSAIEEIKELEAELIKLQGMTPVEYLDALDRERNLEAERDSLKNANRVIHESHKVIADENTALIKQRDRLRDNAAKYLISIAELEAQNNYLKLEAKEDEELIDKLEAERDRYMEALQKIRRFYLSSKPTKQIAFEAIEIAGQALEES